MKPILLIGLFEPSSSHAHDVETEMLNERLNLIHKLEARQIKYVAVNEMWPRDTFVYHNGKISANRDFGHYADGGYLYAFSGFTVACSGISEDEKTGKIDTSNERLQKLRRLYGDHIDIMPPPNYELNDTLRPHVDMIMLPIPQKNVVFVDRAYYREHSGTVNLFCERHKFDLNLTDNDYQNPSWPCNTEIISAKDNLIAITNSLSNRSFIDKLENIGIEAICVPFGYNCGQGGSVHCATNQVPISHLEGALRLFDK